MPEPPRRPRIRTTDGRFFPESATDALDWGHYGSYNFLATTGWVDYCEEKGVANLLIDAPITAKSGTLATLNDAKGLVTYQKYPMPIAPVPPGQNSTLLKSPGVISASFLARSTAT